ncbi:MAG: response regulator [Candidatus Glassbacteria bacterium]
MTKLLVVDDEAPLRLLYEKELTEEGYEVVCAGDGWEAVRKIEEEIPDLVVLDIQMPEMDGLEAMGRILGKYNKLPVIINTAYTSYKSNFMSWAADAYVVKSSNLDELKSTIREVLENYNR